LCDYRYIKFWFPSILENTVIEFYYLLKESLGICESIAAWIFFGIYKDLILFKIKYLVYSMILVFEFIVIKFQQ
jgi:hypothetical protein